MNDVRPWRSRAIAFCTSTSVRVSTEDVASSRIRIAGSAQERPRDRDQLLLAGRDVGRLVVEHRVVAVGQRAHEVVDVGRPRGGEDLLVGGVRRAVGDVLPDRPAEQPGVLQDHPEAAAQVVAGHLVDVVAVEEDPPGVHVVEAHQQVDQGGLAGTGRTHDRAGLPRLHHQVQARGSAACRARTGTPRPRRPRGPRPAPGGPARRGPGSRPRRRGTRTPARPRPPRTA